MADSGGEQLTRDRLVEWLERRAAVLEPDDGLIERALRRCRRHQLRAADEASSALDQANDTLLGAGTKISAFEDPSGAQSALPEHASNPVSARLAKMAAEIVVKVDPVSEPSASAGEATAPMVNADTATRPLPGGTAPLVERSELVTADAVEDTAIAEPGAGSLAPDTAVAVPDTQLSLAAADPGVAADLIEAEAAAMGDDDDLQLETDAVGAVPAAVAEARTVPESMVAVPEDEPVSMATAPLPKPESAARGRAGFLKPGREIAGYQIKGVLGSGGMGQVYRAEQISMGREVAFKVLTPRLAGNAAFRSRFLREARNAGRLQHPNLIAVHDVAEADGLLFFSMELVDGESVGDMIKRDGQLSEQQAIGIVRQALDALAYAHERGLIHRDIKPDNLMVTTTGRVKVADLGLSRGEEDNGDAGTTQSGTMMGTPYYMPPEQGRDARSADARSDLYALGATFYHMLVGTVPFTGRTPMEVLLNASTSTLNWRDGGSGAAVRRVVAKMMAKEPEQRYQTAAEAADALDRLLGGHTGDAALPLGEMTGPVRVRLRGSSAGGGIVPWLVTAAVLVALLLGVLVLLALHGEAEAWRDLRYEVNKESDERRYPQALGLIDAFATANPDQADEPELARLHQQALTAWNDWSLQQIGRAQTEFDRYLNAGNASQAASILDQVANSANLLSPAVEDWLAASRQRLSQLQAGASTPPSRSVDRSRDRTTRQRDGRRSGLVGRLRLGRQTAGSVEVVGPGQAEFRREGIARYQQMPPPEEGDRIDLAVAVPRGGRWSLLLNVATSPIEVRVEGTRLSVWQWQEAAGQGWQRRDPDSARLIAEQRTAGTAEFGLLWSDHGWRIQSPALEQALRSVNRQRIPPALLVGWSAGAGTISVRDRSSD